MHICMTVFKHDTLFHMVAMESKKVSLIIGGSTIKYVCNHSTWLDVTRTCSSHVSATDCDVTQSIEGPEVIL